MTGDETLKWEEPWSTLLHKNMTAEKKDSYCLGCFPRSTGRSWRKDASLSRPRRYGQVEPPCECQQENVLFLNSAKNGSFHNQSEFISIRLIPLSVLDTSKENNQSLN